MRQRKTRIGGHYYPHRVWDMPADMGCPEMQLVLLRARCLEVKVYRMTPTSWRFVGGPGRVDITTDDPRLLQFKVKDGHHG